MNNFNSIRHRVRVTLNAERTEDEVLAELTYLKNRVDLMHNLVAHLHKKLEGFVKDYGHGKGSTEEKKLKKIPEEVVSVVMRQYGTSLLREFPDTSILGNVVAKCGETEHEMAQFQANYETRMEQSVLAPLETMMEDDYEVIQKNMLDLKNLAMKVDLAKSKYKDSNDKLHKFQKSGLVDGEKEKYLREKLGKEEDEVEIANTNLEQFKDAVATNLLNFVNKENETADKLLDLLIIQRDYHYSCYRQIEELLPILRDRMKDYAHKPIYGVALEEHLRVTGREIAVVLEECVSVMTEIGLEEEGLLRIPGSNSRIKRIIAAINYPGEVDWDYFATDVHSLGGALKQYFRDLPEPLLTSKLYDAWIDVATTLQSQPCGGGGGGNTDDDDDDRNDNFRLVAQLLSQLPQCNFNNLRYLIKFLAEMAKLSDVNKMTPTNLAIVMGGNLLWRDGQDPMVLRHSPLKNLLVEILIKNCSFFFPDFELTTKRLLKQEIFVDQSSSSLSSYQVGAGILGATMNNYSIGLVPATSTNSLNSVGSTDREPSPAIGHNQISQSPDGSSTVSTSSASAAFIPGHRRNESSENGVTTMTTTPTKASDGLLHKLNTSTTPRKSFKQRPAPSPGPSTGGGGGGGGTLPRPRSGTPPDTTTNRPLSTQQPATMTINRSLPPSSASGLPPPPPVIRPTPAPRDFSRPTSGPPNLAAAPLPDLPSKTISRENSPAPFGDQPLSMAPASDEGEVDVSGVSIDLMDPFDEPDGGGGGGGGGAVFITSQFGSMKKGRRPTPEKLTPPTPPTPPTLGEKPPISRNKPSLSDDKPEKLPVITNSDSHNHHHHNQQLANESARPPRPQSKPPPPSASAAVTAAATVAAAVAVINADKSNSGSGRPPPRPAGGPPPPPPATGNRQAGGDEVVTHL